MAEKLSYHTGEGAVSFLQGDLTQQETDAIVNAANSSLMGGGGVDGAIHRAGGPAILAECKEIVAKQGKLPAGRAVITTAGNMKSKYVIHTVGPVYYGGSNNEEQVLAGAYRESLKLAAANNLQSVSFPSISTGAYGYPLKPAARTAINEVKKFLGEPSSVKEVVFVLFGEENYNAYAEAAREIFK